MPAACGTCVAIGTQSDATLISSGFHQPDGWPRHHCRIVAAGRPAQQADRRLAVAREDPVALLERVDEAGLDRLVAAEDRVRADASLAVVDDRALVVRPEQDERAVDREEQLVGDALEPPTGRRRRSDHATQVLLDERRRSTSLSETAFLFWCQIAVPAARTLRDSNDAWDGELRDRAGPRDADVRGRDRAPHRGDRAGRPAHGRPAPERGRARRAARDLEADPAPGAARARALGARRGAAREVRRHLRRHRPRARRSRSSPRSSSRSAPTIDVLRARRVLERAVVHEAMRTATADDFAELERTIDLLERHLGERPSVMRADAMFHRALVRALPERDDPGGDARRRPRSRADPRRLARRASPTTRRRSTSTGASSPRCGDRDRRRARRGAGRALPHARDAVREGRSAAAGRSSSARGRAPTARLARRRRSRLSAADERGDGARLGLEHRVRRRRRGPRRRPGAAAAGRSGPRAGRVVQHGQPSPGPRPATRSRASRGSRHGAHGRPGATASSPRSNDAPRRQPDADRARRTCTGSQFATSTNAARRPPSTSSTGGKRPRRDASSPSTASREGDVARAASRRAAGRARRCGGRSPRRSRRRR